MNHKPLRLALSTLLPCLTALAVAPLVQPGIAAAFDRTIPAAVLGQWGFTSISGTTYWDSSTGAYLGSGTGGSQTYTFFKNGTYKMFNYIKARTYGWQLETLTWEDGVVTFDGDRVSLKPTGGKYRVMDNQVAKNNYTRPMRPAELKKNAKTFSWNLSSNNGKAVLHLGNNTNNPVAYKRIK